MKRYRHDTKRLWVMLLWYFVVAWGVLLLSQGVFAFWNRDLFAVSAQEGWRVVWGNMRFAASAVAFFMWPVLLVAAVPLCFRRQLPRLTQAVYGTSMAVMLAANVIDTSYYRWTFRRMTWDIFHYMGDNFEGGLGALFLQFIHDFWGYFLLFFVLEALLLWLSSLVRMGAPKYEVEKPLPVLLSVALLCGGNILLQRGGVIHQHKPLRVVDAGRYAEGSNTALVLNTPFSILRTRGHTGSLQEYTFFQDSTSLETWFSPRYTGADSGAVACVSEGTPAEQRERTSLSPQQRPNVVLIILESFSEEYIGYLNGDGRGWTPFLDSLCQKATVLRGMANGKRSIESVPALLCGIPSLMEEAYITSPYAQNRVLSMPGALHNVGYSTYFFHGAYNGSMNFDSFVKGIGIEGYFGMNEYNAEEKSGDGFDGVWGIFDEPFLQYAAHRMDKEWMQAPERPFFATLYTISSHHPYTVPAQYEGRFPKGPIPILESVGYADYALQQFFATAQEMPWYHNTLFIITADHTAQPIAPGYKGKGGAYAVPMIFFWPGHTVWVPGAEVNAAGTGLISEHRMQHADLYPTLLDLLGLPGACYAFGRSVYDSKESFHIAYIGNDAYLFTHGDQCLLLTPEDMARNVPDGADAGGERLFQAILQQYTQRLIHNRLCDL